MVETAGKIVDWLPAIIIILAVFDVGKSVEWLSTMMVIWVIIKLTIILIRINKEA